MDIREFFVKVSSKIYKKTNINIEGKGTLMKYEGTKFIFDKNSILNIEGKFTTNDNMKKNNGRTSIIRLDENAKMNTTGETSIYYGADIIVLKDGFLSIGNSFINSDCKIRCYEKIQIGDNCAISHDVTIMDSNAHRLNGEIKKEPIIIENNVWIGTKVTILPGVKIGEGAVIAAGSLINKDIPKNTLVGGMPAKVLKEDIKWSLK